MNREATSSSGSPGAMPNGSGAAAILSAGIGAFALGILAVAADQIVALKSLLNFYLPTGPLSGVTTTAIVVWLVVWLILDLRWRRRDVAFSRINTVAFVLLALGLLLTFPPIGDLL